MTDHGLLVITAILSALIFADLLIEWPTKRLEKRLTARLTAMEERLRDEIAKSR